MKKILALLMAVLMVASLAACKGGDDAGKTPGPGEVQNITLSVWTADLDQGEGSWLENRLAAFEAAHPEYKITWEIGVCGEGDTGNTVKSDPSAAADVYMYANDQLGVLYEAGALAKLGGDYLAQVKADNSQTFVDTVTYIDGGVYGFPMTNNTWFMYYNKDIYTEEDIKTMDGLLAKGNVAMQMGTAWYTAGFFMANGCTLFGANGTDAAAGIQFGGEAGYAVGEAMVNLANNPNFKDDVSGSAVAGMKDGTIHAMFSGSWDYAALYGTEEEPGMGDKLGAAALPTITISGKQVQLKAFAGSKAVGVNPHAENPKAAMQLAAFLASEESQLKRFEMRAVTPAHKNLASNATVTASQVAVAEMAVMNNCSVAQPVIAEMGSFWAPMGTFGGAVMNKDVTADNYKDMIDQLYSQLNSTGL
jgi:arabinogalactan oligomer/maltooligosaccharide transport system substrate-binding protein